MEAHLANCPFCGSDDVRTVHGTDDRTIFVSCGKCHALVQSWSDKAISLWNTRVPDPRTAALEAQLAEAKDCIDLFNRMIVRAECAWKEQHPDSTFYPDVPDLILWLKEQVDTLAERRCETCKSWRGAIDADGWRTCKSLHTPMPPDARCDKWQGEET